MTPMLPVDCLGEGTYTAIVRHRRTKLVHTPYVIGEFLPRSLNWGRALNTTSSADITIGVTGADDQSRCCDVVRAIRGGRAQLEFWRDDHLVWLGTIIDKRYDGAADELALSARDLSCWLDWRIVYHTLKPRGIDLADIFLGYLRYAIFAELPTWGVANPATPLYLDNPGFDAFEVIPTGVLGDRTIAAGDLRVMSAELAELASTGVDWTVTNSKMWIGGSELTVPGHPSVPLKLPGWITDEHFTAPPNTRESIDSMATQAWVRGNGVKAMVGGPDPDDGVLMQRVIDAYSIEDQASADAAVRSYHDLSSKPLTYVEGDNGLASTAQVNIQTLIPGVQVPTDLQGGGCVPFSGTLRLERLSVNLAAAEADGGGGEKVTVGLQPLGSSFDARGAG